MYRHVTEEEHRARAETAARLAADGWSYRRIASELGCDATQIGPYLDAAGASRAARNGDVPAGKLTLNALRLRTGQHMATLKSVLPFEPLELAAGRVVFIVDETEFERHRCPADACERVATVAATGTCKRHSKVTVTCERCGRTVRRSPAFASQSSEEFSFCGSSCWAKWRAVHRIGTLRVLMPDVRERLGSIHAKEIAAGRDKKIGAPFRTIDATKAERILKLEAERKPNGQRRHSERAIARIVGVSKTSVHNAIVNRQGVIDHFSLHDLV